MNVIILGFALFCIVVSYIGKYKFGVLIFIQWTVMIHFYAFVKETFHKVLPYIYSGPYL